MFHVSFFMLNVSVRKFCDTAKTLVEKNVSDVQDWITVPGVKMAQFPFCKRNVFPLMWIFASPSSQNTVTMQSNLAT